LGKRFDPAAGSNSSRVNLQADKDIKLQHTVGVLEEKLSRAVETETQLDFTKLLLSEACKERDVLVQQLDDIADRLLRVHPDGKSKALPLRTSYMCQWKINIENDENRRPSAKVTVLDRIEELLSAERKLATYRTQSEKSAADAFRYWTKCMRWESTYDRAMDQLHNAQSQLRHLHTIANESNIQHTIQKQKTNFEKRKAVALAASCRKQQHELDKIAAALFDAKPSPSSVEPY
jgi:hypothetical protein